MRVNNTAILSSDDVDDFDDHTDLHAVSIKLNVFLSFRGIKIMWIFIHNY